MKPFNGHRNRNAWNVALWINNDQALYLTARDCIKSNKTKEDAALDFINRLALCGIVKTNDGAPFNRTNVRLAMRGM